MIIKEVTMSNTPRRLRDIELRKTEENEEMVLEGYAVVFEQEAPYPFGGTEVISKNALDDADLTDVVLRYNHNDTNYSLARTRNKSLELTLDDHGLYFKANLIPTTTNKDAYLMVKEGLLDKCSFAFTIDEYEYDEKRDNTTITKIGKLFDCALVDFPFYDGTSVSARSIDNNGEMEEVIKRERNKAQKKALLDEIIAKEKKELLERL